MLMRGAGLPDRSARRCGAPCCRMSLPRSALAAARRVGRRTAAGRFRTRRVESRGRIRRRARPARATERSSRRPRRRSRRRAGAGAPRSRPRDRRVRSKIPSMPASSNRLREHDLGDLVHRRGVVVGRGWPVSRHLLVGHPAHDVRPGPTDPIELPTLQLVGLGERAGVSVGSCDVPVNRDTHHQNHASHVRRSFVDVLRVVAIPATWGNTKLAHSERCCFDRVTRRNSSAPNYRMLRV